MFCVIFLSLLLDVMRTEILLQIKVSHLNVGGGSEEVAKGVVEDNLTTVVGVLETLVGDVLVDRLRHLRTRYEFTLWKLKKRAQLRRHILLSVESVVGSARAGLLTIGVILGTLNLTDKLGEVLHVGAEGSKLGLNSFNRHYIFLTRLIFKSRKKYIVAMVTINHNRNIKTRLSTVK